MGFILVAYYTYGSIYENSAMLLQSAATALGVSCHVKGIRDLGGWCKNTSYKPKFIRDCMFEFAGYDIAYTDADSMIHAYPSLFDETTADVVIRKQDFPWRQNEYMSGTFFLRNSEKCAAMVSSWIDKTNSCETMRRKPETWDQALLGRAIVESGIQCEQLPHSYIYYDHIEQIEGKVENPVFTHMQYSRKTCC